LERYDDGSPIYFFKFNLSFNLKERSAMPDKLTEMYNEWAQGRDPESLTSFAIFQAGVTAGAVSMRTRAMEKIKDNDTKNAVGQLPDIG
jgi:hypothetical protein